MGNKDCCRVCRYFGEVVDSDVVGQCLRRSPDPIAQSLTGRAFPIIEKTNWCGEFRPNEKECVG